MQQGDTDAAMSPPLAPPPPPLDEPDVSALPPDHPLLRRAQEALHRQLAEQKLRLQEELRERKKALKDAQQRREDVGVELYGYQQHLAKLQLSLEAAGDDHSTAAAARAQADAKREELLKQAEEEEAAANQRKAQAEALQRELDRIAASLRAIQAHNEAVASEVAAAKRATYATEGAVQVLGAQKQEQDLLIESMQNQLRRLTRQAALASEALGVQRTETAAARQLSSQALADMEAVAFEKRQLLGQWRSSLVAMQQRDASLEGLQDSLRQQQEQQMVAASEADGYRSQLAQQRQRNEQAGEVVARLIAQAERLAAQVERVQRRHAELQESHASLQQQLADRQQALEAAAVEGSKLAAQKAALERQQAKLGQAAAEAEQAALERLGEQTFAEKGAAAVLRDIQMARRAVQEKEAAAEQMQSVLQRLEGEQAATAASGERMAAVLAGLEAVVAERAAAVAALEAEMAAGHGDVESKTHQLEGLNRRYQRLVDNAKDVETGPLEATIANLQREIAGKEAAGRDLQRRWISVQGQLVAAQADNAELAEAVAGMRAQQAALQQKRARLDAKLEAQQREARTLSKALAGLRSETSRLNGLLAAAAGQRSSLHEGNVVLEVKLSGELQVLEGRWVALNASIEELRGERGEALAAVVEAEREVMVWERRVQLEKEMREAVDPAYGNQELAAARKEVARLSHAAAALARLQQGLVGELERAVDKREAIGTKARVSQSKKIRDMTASQARRQAEELAKAAAKAEREARAAQGRLDELGAGIEAAQAAAEAAGEQCQALREHQAGVMVEVEVLGREKHKALVATSVKQREVRRYEDALAGRYKPAVLPAGAAEAQGQEAALAAELDRAKRKQERLLVAVQGLAAAEPAAAPQLERAIAHVAALAD